MTQDEIRNELIRLGPEYAKTYLKNPQELTQEDYQLRLEVIKLQDKLEWLDVYSPWGLPGSGL